jgi:hypothetical protein
MAPTVEPVAGPKPMVVTFVKAGRTCSWFALRPPRSRVPGPTMAAGADLPHDLATFVIEQELGLAHGFWGCVADGARFRSLGRKRTPQGTAVIAAHRGELDDAERRVNDVYFAWREGRGTLADDALDAMLERWRALEDGGELVLEWPRGRATSPGAGASGRRRRASA